MNKKNIIILAASAVAFVLLLLGTTYFFPKLSNDYIATEAVKENEKKEEKSEKSSSKNEKEGGKSGNQDTVTEESKAETASTPAPATDNTTAVTSSVTAPKNDTAAGVSADTGNSGGKTVSDSTAKTGGTEKKADGNKKTTTSKETTTETVTESTETVETETETDEGEPNEADNQEDAEDTPPQAPTNSTKLSTADFTVYDANGQACNLSDKLDKPIVVNFWATWCGYCVEELPDFNKLYNEYKDKVNFMMVDLTDGYRETQGSAAGFVKKNGYSFPVYYDLGRSAANAYSISGIPRTLFINADGTLYKDQTGMMNESTLRYYLEALTK